MEFSKKQILIVDDAAENLKLFYGLLKNEYKVSVASSGEAALKFIDAGNSPDLILLDVMMPGLNGFEVCQRLRTHKELSHVPIIFLTGKSGEEDEKKGFEAGGSDYLTKPVSYDILTARVRTHLAAKAHADMLIDKAEYLENEVARRVRELGVIQDVTIQVMASLAETRDNETGGHIRRTQHYVKSLCTFLRKSPKYRDILTDSVIDMYFKSAPLHDIGKVGIPDQILLKPGRLSAEEFEIMKTHTTLGRDTIHTAEVALDVEVDFLTTAKEIAYSHQEKWDGSGYPLGLKEEQIPLSARVMAIADVYDALITKRVYKPAMPHELASKIIIEGSGSHFDPAIVDAFVHVIEDFKAIAERYADP